MALKSRRLQILFDHTSCTLSAGVDLENIVYYRDNTHYFVMTAKKQSLLDKGVIINVSREAKIAPADAASASADGQLCVQDYTETQMLLSSENVNQEALQCYAREAADFGTNYQLPTLDYAMNHCGQPDVAMFDFTSMHASENAALVRERFGQQLVVALVGDSLLEVSKEDSEFSCCCRLFSPHIPVLPHMQIRMSVTRNCLM